jgi:hypothetical protein
MIRPEDNNMINISNPFVVPALVIIWSVDAWLWLALARLILAKLSPDSQITALLCKLTDPPVRLAGRLMFLGFRTEIPEWLLWPITFLTLIILRCLLVSLIVSN